MSFKRPVLVTLALSSALAFASGYWVSRARAAGSPKTGPLTYSGVLSDPNGTFLTGSKNILLQLFSAETGGSALCSSAAATVPLVAGAFSVPLGDNCTAIVRTMPDLWIDVLIDGGSVGRTKLGAVPYALEADHATSASTAADELAASIAALQASVAALKAAPAPLTTIKDETIKASDDGVTGGFASLCLASGFGGSSNTPHACSLAAKRKCANLGYGVGIFVGESDGTFLSILCVK